MREVLAEHGLDRLAEDVSGSRGIHVNVRIVAKWDFADVRRAALALAREVERRIPEIATSKWWKEERGERVFLDYNQNARDRTVASRLLGARRIADALVSCPRQLGRGARRRARRTSAIATVPPRYAAIGDPGAAIDDQRVPARATARARRARDEREGLGDAPWPPHFRKQPGEARRVAPSRKAKSADDQDEDEG